MKLSRIWRIKQIEPEGVIQQCRRPTWITPSEIYLIRHILRKPNFINNIALLFIQNNFYFKNIANTCLPASMLSSSSIVYICTFSFVQLHKYSPNSRCCPLSCLLAVFAMFLAIILSSSSCSSYSWNEWSVPIKQSLNLAFVRLRAVYRFLQSKWEGSATGKAGMRDKGANLRRKKRDCPHSKSKWNMCWPHSAKYDWLMREALTINCQ